MSKDVAPHEGRELEYVVAGIKPLCSLHPEKQPTQYAKAIELKNVVSVQLHNTGYITVTRKENEILHALYKTLVGKHMSVVLRNKEEKQRLMGRLFGYTEEQIDSFIAEDMNCPCGECDWVEDYGAS